MISPHTRRMISGGYFAVRQTLTAALLWLLGYPLKLFVERDMGLMVVVAAPGMAFADNGKYFFAYATELVRNDRRVVLLTTCRTTQREIAAAGGDAVVHPSWNSLFLLLKCGTVILDFDWFKFGAYPLTRGAKLVQIWHGAP